MTTHVDIVRVAHDDAIERHGYALAKLLPFRRRNSEYDWAISEATPLRISSTVFETGPDPRTCEANVHYLVDRHLGAMSTPQAHAARRVWRSVGKVCPDV